MTQLDIAITNATNLANELSQANANQTQLKILIDEHKTNMTILKA